MGQSQVIDSIADSDRHLLLPYSPSTLARVNPFSTRTSMHCQDDMTVGFVRATKAYILPSVLNDVFRFRKAFLTADGVLRTLFSGISTSNGTATAVSALRGSYDDTSIDCQGFQPTGYSSDCPWGLLSYIESAGSSLGVNGTFSEVEVREEGLFLVEDGIVPYKPRSYTLHRCTFFALKDWFGDAECAYAKCFNDGLLV